MTKVIILGAGNVAHHLTIALKQASEVDLVQVYNRSSKAFDHSIYDTIATTTTIVLKNADVYIIAISDNYITALAKQLPKDKLIVHTSGSMSMDSIPQEHRGVFYPLQTFSKAKEVNFKTIPFCIEAKGETDLKLLLDLAKKLSAAVYQIDSEQRKALHVAAVFVNNFTNHLYHQAAMICQAHDVPFEVLKPLIQETVEKLNTLSPKDAQTGPALRNDTKTLEAHLKLLDEKQQKIYKLISQSIYDTYEKL